MSGVAPEVWIAIAMMVTFVVVQRLMRRVPHPYRLFGFAALVILMGVTATLIGRA